MKSASNQSISFTADHWTDDEIKGTYQCRNPDDQGTFEVKLQPEGSKEPPEARNGGCVML